MYPTLTAMCQAAVGVAEPACTLGAVSQEADAAVSSEGLTVWPANSSGSSMPPFMTAGKAPADSFAHMASFDVVLATHNALKDSSAGQTCLSTVLSRIHWHRVVVGSRFLLWHFAAMFRLCMSAKHLP